jgi:hypothetical protein
MQVQALSARPIVYKDPEARRANHRAWHARNREEVNARRRARRAENPELYRERNRRWIEANKEAKRAIDLASTRRKLGIILPDHRSDICEICGGGPCGASRALVPDHDHETGLARGWLCSECNGGLGILGDTIEAIERTLAYLKKYTISRPVESGTEPPKLGCECSIHSLEANMPAEF